MRLGHRGHGTDHDVREGLAIVLPLLALYVVVCAVLQPGGTPVRDEPDLLAAAARLLHGQVVPAGVTYDPRGFLWHGPGLVALLAPLVALDVPLQAIRFLGPLLLAVAAWGFHTLLRRDFDARASRRWTYAFGLYVPFFSVATEIHKEPLAIALVVVGLLALDRGVRRGRALPMAAAGACLGALAMVRLEYGWVAFALLTLAFLTWATRGRRPDHARLLIVPAVAVALCLPWLVGTYELTGKPFYWGTSSGLSLFWMSPTTPAETGQWHSPDEVARNPELRPFDPFFHRLRTVDPVRSDQILRRHALAHVRARPDEYAENVVANVGRLLFAAPMRPELSLIRIGAHVVFNLGLLLAVAWAVFLLRRRRVVAPPQTGPVVVFALVTIAVHLPASASPRMLLPVVPALFWLAARSSGPQDAHPAAPC